MNTKPQAEINMVLAAGALETQTEHGHKGFGSVSDLRGPCVGATSETNSLIAEFMELEKSKNVWDNNEYAYTMKHGDVFNKWVIPSEMKYHSSWDWIMPVFEKIQSIEYEPKDGDDDYNWNIPYIRTLGNNMCRINRMPLSKGNNLIDCFYESIVEFIKWYNQNKK